MNNQWSKIKIRKAVFPVAGMGTRFLPATKANPKEMMPIVDKPLIQYAVEEAIAAGIQELIFVTSSAKRAIEDHFDNDFELEARLEAQGKIELLNMVRNILPKGISCVYVRQREPLGLGHAILCAESLVGNEPFAVLLADDLIKSEGISCLEQMIEKLKIVQSSMVAVQKIAPTDTQKYGVIGVNEPFPGFDTIQSIIEKPALEKAPSLLGVVGRYLLMPSIFDYLKQIKPEQHVEWQLTDAIAALLAKEPVYALEFLGKRYDCGSKLGYLNAIVAYGLAHAEVGEEFRKDLASIS